VLSKIRVICSIKCKSLQENHYPGKILFTICGKKCEINRRYFLVQDLGRPIRVFMIGDLLINVANRPVTF